MFLFKIELMFLDSPAWVGCSFAVIFYHVHESLA